MVLLDLVEIHTTLRPRTCHKQPPKGVHDHSCPSPNNERTAYRLRLTSPPTTMDSVTCLDNATDLSQNCYGPFACTTAWRATSKHPQSNHWATLLPQLAQSTLLCLANDICLRTCVYTHIYMYMCKQCDMILNLLTPRPISLPMAAHPGDAQTCRKKSACRHPHRGRTPGRNTSGRILYRFAESSTLSCCLGSFRPVVLPCHACRDDIVKQTADAKQGGRQ